jgi:hypothetical protein
MEFLCVNFHLIYVFPWNFQLDAPFPGNPRVNAPLPLEIPRLMFPLPWKFES